MNEKMKGHLLAIIVITIWSTTFASTKILLRTFEPIEILVLRFAIGFLVLLAIRPKLHKLTIRQELYYLAAGASGVTLYYMLENSALQYTTASNAGVIISTAPFFTAVLSHFILKGEERFKWNFFVGFVIAFTGICLIMIKGGSFSLNLLGDLMIVAAALSWAIYCVVLKRINTFDVPMIESTRRIFAWGLVFMIPIALIKGLSFSLVDVIKPVNLGNLLFLGVGACALCFIIWNTAVKIIGTVKANFYIYLTPVVTLIVSAIVLHEEITPRLILGTVLTLCGVVVSEMKWGKKRRAGEVSAEHE